MNLVAVERYHVPSSQVWPGSRGSTQGNVHLHVAEDVTLGRLVRRRGECLCSKKHGSYERPLELNEEAAKCPGCDSVAVRHGIEWPSARRERLPKMKVLMEDYALEDMRRAAVRVGVDLDERYEPEGYVLIYGERLMLQAFPAELHGGRVRAR